MAGDTFFGGSITLGTTGENFRILEGDRSGMAVEDIDVSHGSITDGFKEYIPSDLVEGGEYSFTVLHDPDVDETNFVGVLQTITITYPLPAGKTTPAKRQFQGYIKDYGEALPIDDKMTAEITVKVAGKVTVTPSA